MIARAEQCVTEAARMILGHELELERTGVAPGDRLEHRLVRIGDHDDAQEPGVGGFVEGPVEHRTQRHRQHFLGQPPADRMKAGTESAAGDHRGIQHSQRMDRATSIFHARSPRSPAPCQRKEQGVRK
jgi:hypothetical protein